MDRTVVFFYTPLKCSELKKSVNIEVPISEIASSGSIPGLYIYDNFISEEEEKELIKGIDAGKWVKLLNRRVQHFGYEFKYGTNNVDTQEQIGDFPDYCKPMMPGFEKVLRGFDDGKEVVKRQDEQGNYFETKGMFDQLTLNDYMPG